MWRADSLEKTWCWEGLGAVGEADDRGWDDWMASRTRWTQVWVNSGSWWWTGRHGVLQFMVSQRVRHNWATELSWTLPYVYTYEPSFKPFPKETVGIYMYDCAMAKRYIWIFQELWGTGFELALNSRNPKCHLVHQSYWGFMGAM